MKSKSNIVAQRLINLYRQAHVILGGWATLNPIFLDEATPDVIREMRNIPTSKYLIKHIENLRSGKTPMDSIDSDLLPYGGMMSENASDVSLSQEEWFELESGLDAFVPTQEGIDAIENLDVVKRFGDEWIASIKSALNIRPDLIAKWELVGQTYRAYQLWHNATNIISQPLTERIRAHVQADITEYETYLPMFGDSGKELLMKLRHFISSMNHDDIKSADAQSGVDPSSSVR